MHDTAYALGSHFFQCYFASRPIKILEIGSQNVNGTLRDRAPAGSLYVGADVTPGAGVDVVFGDRHALPFADEHFNAVISTSCFEHDQMFWLTFIEMARVTASSGYIYINAPSNGAYHSYPSDNWRFYPDSGRALAAWAQHQGRDVTLVESFIAKRKSDKWNDC